MRLYKLITQELFYILSTAVLIFIIIELLWPRLILAYFNVAYLLILWFINGILLLVIKPNKITD
jgi:hypothetical protein